MQQDLNSIRPVQVNKDVWFYPTAKGFEFVVWSRNGNIRQAIEFTIPKSRLRKYYARLKQ